MGELKNSYITNAGKKMLFGGGRLTYTKASLFNQDLSKMTVEQIRELSQLKTPLLSVPVAVVNKSINKDSTTVNIEADFQNDTLKADLPFGEIGFFAKTDKQDETLIAIVMASPDAYLSAGSPDGTSTDAITVTLAMSIGDASKVDAVVDPAGSVTPASLASAVAKASADLEKAISKKDDTTDVDSKLAKKADATDVDKKISTINQTITADKADSDNKIKANSDLIATKANSSDLDKTNATVAKKDDTTDVDDKLAKKDDITDVDSKLAKKADTDTVNSQIADAKNTAKSNEDKLQTAINTKADQSSVNTVVALLKSYVPDIACYDTANDLPDGYDANNAFDGWRRAWGIAATNFPTDPLWGFLGCFKVSQASFMEIFIDSAYSKLYFRMTASGTWQNWTCLSDINTLNTSVADLQTQIGTKADQSTNQATIASLQSTVKSQAQTIASLQATVSDQSNQIAYIKANYIEGKVFPKGSEKDAVAWTKDNTQKLAIISDLKK